MQKYKSALEFLANLTIALAIVKSSEISDFLGGVAFYIDIVILISLIAISHYWPPAREYGFFLVGAALCILFLFTQAYGEALLAAVAAALSWLTRPDRSSISRPMPPHI
jgi:hypothetical protein